MSEPTMNGGGMRPLLTLREAAMTHGCSIADLFARAARGELEIVNMGPRDRRIAATSVPAIDREGAAGERAGRKADVDVPAASEATG